MKHVKSFLLFVSIMLILPAHSNAQFLFSKQSLSINDAPQHRYMAWTINDWAGLYWTHTPYKFLQIDLSASNPRFAGTGDKIVFYNSSTSRYNNIEVGSVLNYSDAKAKENVQNLTSGLNTILSLRPVSYQWKEEGAVPSVMSDVALGDSTNVSYGSDYNSHSQIGFIAQEVEEVLPEAVETNDSGDKLVNYIAMIPLLVQSVQELQATVEAQAQVIERLSNGQSASMLQDSYNKIISCSPNPASSHVSVSLQLDCDVKSAKLMVSSVTGNREMLTDVNPSENSVTLDLSSIDKGIHIVSLYTDGLLIDSCRLIKE